MKERALTGDRPTGPLHLGHYVGSLKNRLELQESMEQLVMIADIQALTDNAGEPQKVRENVLEVAYDYLAVGIKEEESTIFIQSLVPELYELTIYYLNLVTWNRLKHNPTVKQEIKQKNLGEAVPAGFMIYPISQVADITAFKATVVPVGEDQRPMLEQAREVVRNFNRLYKKEVLVEPKALIPKISRLPGTDGQTKMSKSLGNAIYLSDEPDAIAKKIKKMQSAPKSLDEPGVVEGHTVFTYLDAFGEDSQKIEELKAHYRKGGLGDKVVKDYLVEVLEHFLKPIRQKRAEVAKDPGAVMEMLKRGSEKAREIAAQTVKEVREVMHLNYD